MGVGRGRGARHGGRAEGGRRGGRRGRGGRGEEEGGVPAVGDPPILDVIADWVDDPAPDAHDAEDPVDDGAESPGDKSSVEASFLIMKALWSSQNLVWGVGTK